MGSQGLDKVAFLLLPECEPVHLANSSYVARLLFSDFNQREL